MAVLYDRSVTWRGLVVGTGNKTESLIGYTTLFGDNACAFNPIGDLYKSQVRQLAAAIGVPDAIIRKAPVGRPVARPDRRDRGRVQLPGARPAAVLAGRQAPLARGARGQGLRRARWSSGSTGLVAAAEFKRQVPPIAKLGPRTAGVDYLYPRRRPGSTASRAWPGGRVRTARRAAGGTLYVVATPIGNLGDVTLRALETLRAVPLIAAEDTRLSRRLLARYDIETRLASFHARNATGRSAGAARPPPRRRRPGARHRRRYAGRQRPGRGARRAWAARAGRSSRSPAPSAVLAAVAASGVAGPRWTFEGFLPRTGRDRRERLAGSPPTSAAASSTRRRVGCAATLRDLAAACGPERPAAVCRELTKLHEEIVRGPLGELAERAAAGGLDPARRVRARRRGGGSGAGPGPGGSEPAAGRCAGRGRRRRGRTAGRRRRRARRGRPRVAAATGIPRRSCTAPRSTADRFVTRPAVCDPAAARRLPACPPSTTPRTSKPATAPRGAAGWRRTTRPRAASGSSPGEPGRARSGSTTRRPSRRRSASAGSTAPAVGSTTSAAGSTSRRARCAALGGLEQGARRAADPRRPDGPGGARRDRARQGERVVGGPRQRRAPRDPRPTSPRRSRRTRRPRRTSARSGRPPGR